MVTPIYNFSAEMAPCLDTRLRMASCFFILCVGFDTELAEGFTSAYRREFSPNWISLQKATCRVETTTIVYVDRFGFDAALKALSHVPAVIVLNEEVFLSKITKRYLRKLKVPLVRVTSEQLEISELSKDDYYYGACATILAEELTNSAIVCPTLDYALLISIRMNTDVIDRKKPAPCEEAAPATDIRRETTAIPIEIVADKESILGTDSGSSFEPIIMEPKVPTASAALYKHVKDTSSVVIRAVTAFFLLSSVAR